MWTRLPPSGSATKGREASSYLRKGSGSRIQEFFLSDLPGAEGEVHTGSCCLLGPSDWAGIESWSKGLSVKLGVGPGKQEFGAGGGVGRKLANVLKRTSREAGSR